MISLIKSGDESKGSFEDVGYLLSRANLSAIDAIIALNSSTIEFLEDDKNQIIRGMINMDIFYAETIRDCKVAKNDYLKIYQKSLEIVALLNATEAVEFQFAHYTTQETANTLIFNNSPFRLHSVTTANDPKEGYPLLNFLGFTGSRLLRGVNLELTQFALHSQICSFILPLKAFGCTAVNKKIKVRELFFFSFHPYQ